MTYRLDEILDSSRVQELLIQFQSLTGLNFGIVDAQGTLLASSGVPAACKKLFKKHGKSSETCVALQPKKALENLPESGHTILEAGQDLHYALHPIHMHDDLAGVLFVCPFRLREPPPPEEGRELGTLPDDIPELPPEKMELILSFFSNLVGLLTDTSLSRTELAARQADLRRERHRFQALFQASGDPIIILDTRRTILDLNAAAERQFGWSRDELVGQATKILHQTPELADEFGRHAYPQLVNTGIWRGEWPLRKCNAEIFIGEVTISKMTDEQEDPLGFVAIVRDVSERKRMEEKREMALTEMEAIFENSLMGVALVRNRVILRINQRGAEIFGYRPEELEGLNSLEVQYSYVEHNAFEQAYSQGLESRGWFTTEHRFRKRDGSGVWIRLYAKALDPDNLGQGVIWAFDDVSDRRVMEETLARAKETAEQASRSKSLFLANMSHEIRTPLSGVLNMLQLVREEVVTPEMAENLDAALSAGHSLLTVVGDVIDLSRVESGHVDLASEPLDPGRLVKDILAAFRPQARQKNISLEANPDEDHARLVLGDEGRIRQVLFNLVSNALKHTDSGFVRLHSSLFPLPGDRVRLQFCVEDSGEGIPEDQQDSIFKAFVRGGGNKKREGSGLGLAIVKNLVERMGGEVHLQSEPGKGTIICLSLPLAEARPDQVDVKGAQPLAPAPAPAPAPEHPGRSVNRILVAEDNRVNQIAVRRYLEQRGYEVVCVADGSEAVEAVRKENFGLVLMDIQMPGMDGEEATRHIRNMEKGRNLPIVATTAYAMKGDRERFLEQGMNDYLPKPVDLNLLGDTVAHWMGTTGGEQASQERGNG